MGEGRCYRFREGSGPAYDPVCHCESTKRGLTRARVLNMQRFFEKIGIEFKIDRITPPFAYLLG